MGTTSMKYTPPLNLLYGYDICSLPSRGFLGFFFTLDSTRLEHSVGKW